MTVKLKAEKKVRSFNEIKAKRESGSKLPLVQGQCGNCNDVKERLFPVTTALFHTSFSQHIKYSTKNKAYSQQILPELYLAKSKHQKMSVGMKSSREK